jgi:iron complex outermembrane receptor protein
MIPGGTLRALWRARVLLMFCGLGAFPAAQASAQGQPAERGDLTSLSLEELLDVKVVSASKHAAPAFTTPAAVYVLTSEDLRRSGVRTVAEALRAVPGLDVARIDANKWAISARGFNSRFSNKLLVLIDGRSIYSSLFTSVFWEVQSLPLAEIERIEVIRGPGGSLWGVNAVNGVINIITKGPEATESGRLTAGGGTLQPGFTDLGYSSGLPGQGRFRLWGTFSRFEEGTRPGGRGAGDSRRTGGAGFRADWQVASGSLTIFGGALRSDYDDRPHLPLLTPPYQQELQTRVAITEGYAQARWRRPFAGDGAVMVQVYTDHERRREVVFDHEIDTLDFDVQAETSAARRHRLVGGFGLRLMRDDLPPSQLLSFEPVRESRRIWSGFLQDEIALAGDRARLTLGTKLENNQFTGFEVQPTVRLSGRVGSRQFLWSSVSRAVRTASRAERDLRIWLTTVPSPSGLPVQVVVLGSADVDSEELLASEVGYRLQATDSLTFDLTAFDHRYHGLLAAGTGAAHVELDPPRIVQELPLMRAADAETRGIEITGGWVPRPGWMFTASYWGLRFASLTLREGAQLGRTVFDSAPRHQARLGSRLDLPRGVELDLALQWATSVPSIAVPSHLGLDGRLGWRLRPDLELALSVRDLLSGSHVEFGITEFGDLPSRVEPSASLSLSWMW